MAEAFLNKNFNTTTVTKKRKNDANHAGGKKRSHTVSQMSDDIILLDPRPQRKFIDQSTAADSVAAAAAAVGIEPDISYVQPIQSNTAYKRSFHIGGKRYIIFAGPNGLIQNIYFKEWDGQKVLNQGITLNIPKIMMIMHLGQQISNELERITSGAKDIDVKKHIGGGFYLSVNSPYKYVGIRKWNTNSSGTLYPTSEGVSLKATEWREALDVINKLYTERLELYQCVSCILDPNKPDHDKKTCTECSHLDTNAKGEVFVDIPL